jgi:glycerol uptake facilitator-like aquaporin
VQGLFIEMILTGVLVFAIFMLAAEKHKGTYIAPVGIGLALFVAELVGVYFTGGESSAQDLCLYQPRSTLCTSWDER